MRVHLERCVGRVQQHPQSASGVKGDIQGAVGQGELVAGGQSVLSTLLQAQHLDRSSSGDTARQPAHSPLLEYSLESTLLSFVIV